MRTIATIVSALAVLMAGCGGSPPEEQEETTPPPVETVTKTVPPPASAEPEPVPPPAPTEAEPSGGQWTMPDLVGTVLQDAQNQIQQLTGDEVFFTGSRDLSGRERNQVLDDNWRVCTQSVAPGATLTPTSRIEFGVVKLDENCP